MAWRANTSNISFDNLRVTGSPASYNTLVYLHGDHLGSIGAVTNSSGALLDMTRFLPFGGYRGSDPAFLTERAFTGHKMNNTAGNDLGLIYMNARFYSPYINRFISADSIVPNPANPQSYNRYSYVENRPLNFSDPTGHKPSDGCEYEGCATDADNWGWNAINYLLNDTDFSDPTSNPIGQIALDNFYFILPLALEDGASVEEAVMAAFTAAIKQANDYGDPVKLLQDRRLFGGGVIEAGLLGALEARPGGGSAEMVGTVPRYDRSSYGSWQPGKQQEIFERDNYTCSYCGQRGGDLTVDHVNSLRDHWYNQGGHAMTNAQRNAAFNDSSNLVTACLLCNQRKGADTLLGFLRRISDGG